MHDTGAEKNFSFQSTELCPRNDPTDRGLTGCLSTCNIEHDFRRDVPGGICIPVGTHGYI